MCYKAVALISVAVKPIESSVAMGALGAYNLDVTIYIFLNYQRREMSHKCTFTPLSAEYWIQKSSHLRLPYHLTVVAL